MARTWYEKGYVAILLMVFGGIVLHAPLSVWLGTIFPGYVPLIKSWKEILLVVAAGIGCLIVTKRRLWKSLFGDRLLWLIVFIAGLHLLYIPLLFNGWSAAAAGLAIDLRYLLFFSLVYLLVVVFPAYRTIMIKVGIAGAVVVAGFAGLQLFLPADILSFIGYNKTTIEPYLTVDDNPDFVRINSTLRGPNPLGAFAVIVLSVAAAAWARAYKQVHAKKETVLVAVVSFLAMIALWNSYSRSALLAAIVALGIVGAVAVGRKMLWRFALPVAIVVAGIGLFWGGSFVSTVLLHDSKESGAELTSNEQHVGSLEEGVRRLIETPLGSGIGSAGSASLYTDAPATVESQYFFVAHEVGAVGLVLFLLLFVLLMKRLWYSRRDWLALGVFASGAGLAGIGLLLPVWSDDTVAIIWWGLAALVVGGTHGTDTSKQKTKRAV